MTLIKICRVKCCDRIVHGRGLCQMHYYRQRKNGTTKKLKPKESRRSEKKKVLAVKKRLATIKQRSIAGAYKKQVKEITRVVKAVGVVNDNLLLPKGS